MEILEKQDPEKKRLMDEAKRHKDNLASDMHFVSEKTEKILTNAVIIGGALALTYVLVQQLSRKKSKKKKAKTVKLVTQAPQQEATEQEEEDSGANSILAEIGTKIANEATVFLLDLAKEKLMEYLRSGKEKQNENH